jgi:Protein of unknown function (DUF1566)
MHIFTLAWKLHIKMNIYEYTKNGRCNMKKLIAAVLLFIANNANAALVERLDGLAYYDTILDITWAANANLNGLDTWHNQNTWVSNLTIAGVDGWRLPSADVNGDGTVIDCSGGSIVDCEDNEMGFLYWEENITPLTSGPFSNIQSNLYWSSTESTTSSTSSWIFRFSAGDQRTFNKGEGLAAWAVHNGDISAVPVPAAIWLFSSGIIGLIGFTRR